jgi:glycosyltransferase involved in cell wall biosynthesis
MHDTLQEVLPETFPWHLRWRFGLRYRQSASQATRILVLSESTRRDVSRYYQVPDDRLRVVYPAPDPSFRPQGPASEEVLEARGRVGLGSSPFFLFVGKASRRRNLPAILEALTIHLKNHPTHKLVFVGPGDFESASHDNPSIVRAGHVAESVLRGLMASAVALLYPSEYEGFGLPVVEAMASGCPVITLRRPPLVEAGGDAAWYLDHAEPEALAGAMNRLATDSDARASTVSRGLSQASRFTQRRFADEVKTEIRELSGTRTPMPLLKHRRVSRKLESDRNRG